MKAPLTHFLIVMMALGTIFAQQLDAETQEPVKTVENPADDGAEPVADEASAEEPADEESPAEEVSENADDGQKDEPGDGPSAKDETTPAEESAPAEDSASAEEGETALADEPATEEPVMEEPIVEAPAAPQPGLAVRVERQQGVSGAIDPSQVKLLAPFPAKLLAQVPAGWRIEKASDAPAFSRDVELSPGSSITLSVKPHILVPEADGESVFAVPEPGYNASLEYRQNATVGAILATSIRQLDEDARQLGGAIDQLQQLLVSLPQPEPAAQENPAPTRQR